MKKMLALMLFCVLWANKTYSQEVDPDRRLHVPGHTNCYLLDVDGDGSPDVITEDFVKAETFSKETDREVYVIRMRNGERLQVRIVETAESIQIITEEVGTAAKPGDKILRP